MSEELKRKRTRYSRTMRQANPRQRKRAHRFILKRVQHDGIKGNVRKVSRCLIFITTHSPTHLTHLFTQSLSHLFTYSHQLSPKSLVGQTNREESAAVAAVAVPVRAGRVEVAEVRDGLAGLPP